MWVRHALAADHPDRVGAGRGRGGDAGRVRLPAAVRQHAGHDRLWHFAFIRLAEVNEQLIQGGSIYFGSTSQSRE